MPARFCKVTRIRNIHPPRLRLLISEVDNTGPCGVWSIILDQGLHYKAWDCGLDGPLKGKSLPEACKRGKAAMPGSGNERRPSPLVYIFFFFLISVVSLFQSCTLYHWGKTSLAEEATWTCRVDKMSEGRFQIRINIKAQGIQYKPMFVMIGVHLIKTIKDRFYQYYFCGWTIVEMTVRWRRHPWLNNTDD